MQPYICKKVIERTNPILDTLATWYTMQAFFVLNACNEKQNILPASNIKLQEKYEQTV